ncbi:hypothetical protein [Halomonas rhizosphaerae]|uniref:Metal-binding protein n=1 Tax=Halomonas rhizosphaerae TaxID=3043296 RepID=A0ABT6UZE1_9GAMM|nr:hypothetical protein [Halomonas rhizosphaerae]MDI5891329.1 hypothetical protein [Halomonas rhizosphaerae]
MRPITLDVDPQGRRILSCDCGTIEIARASDWQEFTVEALDNDLAVVTCGRCDRNARLGQLDAEQEIPQSTW